MNAALGQTLMNLQFYSTSQTSKPTEQQQQQYQQNPSITYQQAAQMKGIGNANQQQQQQQQQEMALNLSRSLQQQQPVNIVNMTSNKLLQPQQIQLQQHQIQQIQLQHQQQQPQLLETLMHAVPNATSTPNPIQQQQQDIFTNLLLKFDPTQFFVPKKDQLSFIFNNSGQTGAATTTASVSQNPTVIQFVQPVKQAQQPHQQFIQQQLQPQQPQHFQIIQQQPQQQQMQIQMQHQQQQHQIYLQHQQQQQHIYQQQQQQQFNGMANQSRLGQLVSASAVSTGSGGNVKQTSQQPPQSQNDDSSNDSDEEGNSTLGGNPHEKPYKCSQCFKLFRKKVHLNQHMRIHSGERPYACDFCEKRFTQLSHLWQHTRRHTGDKPYKCDVGSCDKAFSQLSNLQSHIRTHGSGAVSAHLTTLTNPTTTTAAPQSPVSTAISDAIAAVSGGQTTTASSNNKCTKCWKQFSSKDELAAHMSTRHAGKAARNQLKRHFCEICHKRFATEGVIRTHVCSKLPNAVLVRNSEGSLVMRSNSALPQLINK